LNRNDIRVQLSSKIDSLLTLNLRGESHDKGLPENADVKASRGLMLYGGMQYPNIQMALNRVSKGGFYVQAK
jgi:hypothetical protein